MLTKDLLRVSRRGGGYQPQFIDQERESLAARVLGCYQGHVGKQHHELTETLTELERESDDFKLVRGFAKLLERDTRWEVQSDIDPERAREAVFAASEKCCVVTSEERTQTLQAVAQRLDTTAGALEQSLYADLDAREVLTAVEPRWDPAELVTQYNLSLAQTALFDATEVRVRSSDPRSLVSAIKRLGLMYEIRDEDGDWEILVTGPDSLFRSTRRYGTQFARLLRTIASTDRWSLTATIDDRGTERHMTLDEQDPVAVPGVEPLTTDRYDSQVEADFATRFESLDLDWTLEREPAPLSTGEHVMIPDFALDHEYADFRLFFEIMGFWTPEYVEKKLSQLDAVEGIEMLVAVDESLGVSEDIEARDHRAITYSGTISLKDLRQALRPSEQEITDEIASQLPDELRPDADAISLAAMAEEYDVSEAALDGVEFPDHERVGRTLIRPAVLAAIDDELSVGMSLEEAETVLETWEITESSAVLSRLGYEVVWEGLSGGTLSKKDDTAAQENNQ